MNTSICCIITSKETTPKSISVKTSWWGFSRKKCS